MSSLRSLRIEHAQQIVAASLYGVVDAAAGLAQLLVGLAKCGLPGPAPLVKNSAAPQAESRRLVAKVEWHPGELVARVGFIVTNLSRPVERVTKFYDGRGTAEQWIKEGKNAINWTRLSCHSFRNNAFRLQLHALAYNLGNFLRTLALSFAGTSPTAR